MTGSVAGSDTGSKAQEAIWTRLVIDPPADLLVRSLVRVPWVTPNRVTAVAGLLALASALSFARGWLVVGAVLFQVRFLVDCLDGRLARIRGVSTLWGASLDLVVDVVGIAVCYAALAWYVVASDAAGPALIAALVAGNGLYVWTLAHRKSLPGGAQRDWLAAGSSAAVAPSPTAWGRYVAFMARRGMVPTPYAVELEALALTVLPLVAGLTGALWLAVAGLWAATAFYGVASALNVYRTWRLTSGLERS